MRRIDLIVIHCSATKSTSNYSPEQLGRDHLARGIKGPMGYHYYIRRDGTLVIGRPVWQEGAHVYGYNKHSIGICYEGGLNEFGIAADTRTPAQKQTLTIVLTLLQVMLKELQATIARITGHRNLSPDVDGDGIIEQWEWMKQCPCFDAEVEYQHLNQ